MDIFLYLIIFIMGTLFGSFLTLATYRLPLGKNITYEHSFCPKCNHKLNFFDLIPVISYIILGGKCRYCKKKISPRYFLFEILTGILFVLLAYMLELNINSISYVGLVEFALGVSYLVFLLLIAGIDLENSKIDKKVLIYGVTIAIINVMYQYISCVYFGYKYNLNRLIIYLLYLIILSVLNLKMIRKTNKYDYVTDVVVILIIMCLFTYEITTIITIIGCMLAIAFKLILSKTFNKRSKKKSKKKVKKMPIAFYLVCSNCVAIFISYIYSVGIF